MFLSTISSLILKLLVLLLYHSQMRFQLRYSSATFPLSRSTPSASTSCPRCLFVSVKCSTTSITSSLVSYPVTSINAVSRQSSNSTTSSAAATPSSQVRTPFHAASSSNSQLSMASRSTTHSSWRALDTCSSRLPQAYIT